MDLTKLREDIAKGDVKKFYKSAEWIKKRKEIVKFDHYRCTECGHVFMRSSQAIVHHVTPLKEKPEWALLDKNPATGERQLVTVCRRCHRDIHEPQRGEGHAPRWVRKYYRAKKKAVTEERWD